MFTIWEKLSEIVDKNVRIVPILKEDFKTLAYAFFDIFTLSGTDSKGNPVTSTTIAPRSLKGIETTLTVDGESIKWYDYAVKRFKSTVVANATLTAAGWLFTAEITDTPLLARWDKIFFIKSVAAESEIDGIVDSVDTAANTVTFKVESVNGVTYTSGTIAVRANQLVSRGAWLRNDNEEITRSSAIAGYEEFTTYIQHFSERMEVTKKDLNKVYTLEEEPKKYVDLKLGAHIHTLVSGVAEQIYKGRNKGSGVWNLDKMQMLGLEEISRRAGTIVDLSSETDMEKALRREAALSIRGASKLGGSKISWLCNSAFLTELSEIDQDKIRYDKKVDVLETVFPRYLTPHGEVEILRDPTLDELYPYSLVFMAPLDYVKLWIRENQDFEPKSGISKSDQSIRFYAVTHNLREKELYDMEFECGLLPAWMMTWAYRMVKNFTVS